VHYTNREHTREKSGEREEGQKSQIETLNLFKKKTKKAEKECTKLSCRLSLSLSLSLVGLQKPPTTFALLLSVVLSFVRSFVLSFFRWEEDDDDDVKKRVWGDEEETKGGALPDENDISIRL